MTETEQVMYGQRYDNTLNEVEKPEGAEREEILVDKLHPIDDTFKKYGHMFYPIFIKNARGRWTTQSGFKLWKQNNEYRKLLPRNMPVYPFEQLEEDLEETINKELKDSHWRIMRRDHSHNGFSAYWTIISDDIRHVVKGSYVLDDVIQLGVVIRNGIGTGIALGADFMTYRLACLNGAIGRGNNFGSLSVRHIGDQKRMIETFRNGIETVTTLGKAIFEYYQRATEMKFNEKMGQLIYKRTMLPEKYLPGYFHIDTKQKELEKRCTISSEGRNITLYEVFNDLTQNLTRSLNMPETRLKKNGERVKTVKLHFSSFSSETRALHKALVDIVDNRTTKMEAA